MGLSFIPRELNIFLINHYAFFSFVNYLLMSFANFSIEGFCKSPFMYVSKYSPHNSLSLLSFSFNVLDVQKFLAFWTYNLTLKFIPLNI